ncbi:Hsp20/alpha crystallin family protein [Pedobacter aquatilis]|uniref:Hsp20/alpha crystallin family protein n=1 Tax=Pedobacter aquatilis TaxID=351343 RepID=UPI0025B34162|nr:Hsp20/alpha crystallin family protein [Pedobacter aquatilis]MDN3586512.1 Hsp20/alpha crystallin family protein [Pedobacter aquatilis]
MYNEDRCHKGKMNRGWVGNGGRFGHHHGGRFARHAEHFFNRFRSVAANIEEKDEEFIIHLYAPALIKEHLKVVTKDDVLTISYTPKEDVETDRKFSRREYSNGAFERAFALNGKVISENISASYTDGILKISLPKNPETNKPAKDIAVN